MGQAEIEMMVARPALLVRIGDGRGLFLDVIGVGPGGEQKEHALLELAFEPEFPRVIVCWQLGGDDPAAARLGPC